MIIILIGMYIIGAWSTYELCDYALFRCRLMEKERWISSKSEDKRCSIVVALAWPVTLWDLVKLVKELNEIEKWR